LEGIGKLIARGAISDGRIAAVALRRAVGILEGLHSLGSWRSDAIAAEVLPRLLAILGEDGLEGLNVNMTSGFCYNAGRLGLAGEPALLVAAKRLAYTPGMLDEASFQQITNALHGLAKCGAVAAAGAVRTIGDVAATRLNEAKPMELANLCWALGQLEGATPDFTSAWCAELVRRRLGGFNVQARGMATLSPFYPACASAFRTPHFDERPPIALNRL
jgi:hypothetical protein